MHDIFLSYSSQDRDRLTPLVNALEAQGWTVFWDHRAIKVADDWHKVIGTAIQQCTCVIVAWSENSIGSTWVREEALVAKERGVLYPIFLDMVPIPFGFTLLQTADFTSWNGEVDQSEFVELTEQLSIRLNIKSVANSESARPLITGTERKATASTTALTLAKHRGKLLLGGGSAVLAGFVGYHFFGNTIPPSIGNDELPKMIQIPSGSFMMGCRDEKESNCRDDEKFVHEVSINQFYLAETEVTVGQYFTCVEDKGCSEPEWGESGNEYNIKTGSNDYYRELGRGLTHPNSPIVGVSWYDAQKYIRWLGNKTGGNYRLPSEAEWEYAARGGAETSYSWGSSVESNNANCNGCSDTFEFLSPAASFPANRFGLFDMHGNVWEWVEDRWHDNYRGAPNDGTSWSSGNSSDRVLRGGSWNMKPQYLRSANRGSNKPDYRYRSIGFRPAQDYIQ